MSCFHCIVFIAKFCMDRSNMELSVEFENVSCFLERLVKLVLCDFVTFTLSAIVELSQFWKHFLFLKLKLFLPAVRNVFLCGILLYWSLFCINESTFLRLGRITLVRYNDVMSLNTRCLLFVYKNFDASIHYWTWANL